MPSIWSPYANYETDEYISLRAERLARTPPHFMNTDQHIYDIVYRYGCYLHAPNIVFSAEVSYRSWISTSEIDQFGITIVGNHSRWTSQFYKPRSDKMATIPISATPFIANEIGIRILCISPVTYSAIGAPLLFDEASAVLLRIWLDNTTLMKATERPYSIEYTRT